MLLSTIGKSRLMSKALVRSIASVAPMFGFDVRYDTKKVRMCNADGSYKVNPVTGKGVYRRVGKLPNRFFLARKHGLRKSKLQFLNDMYIVTARKAVSRPNANIDGTTYTSHHRGFLTIARENYGGRYMWDIQNRDVVAK
jgi:hypothetical protein